MDEDDFKALCDETLKKINKNLEDNKLKNNKELEILFDEHRKFNIILSKLALKRHKIFKEISTDILIKLKQDYIDKHGLETYIINEESVKKDMINTINKQCKMLVMWNEPEEMYIVTKRYSLHSVPYSRYKLNFNK